MKINIEKLHRTFGNKLNETTIVQADENCFDLVDEFGELLAMNGDEVEIVKADDDRVTMRNCFDGLRFVLTGREFDIGIVF